MQNGRRAAAALAVTSAMALAIPLSAQAAESFYGVTASNRLVTFQSDSPGAIRSGLPITGLLDSDTGIKGIDVRPADNGLYGIGSSGILYEINPATGNATAISQTARFAVSGGSFGVDFDPVADRLRLVSNTGQNLRVNPLDGSATTDSRLAYAAGDTNAGKAPAVVAAAYTHSSLGSTATELFGLDTGRDALVLQSPPNGGVLSTRGPLGVDAVSPAGFDVAASDGRAWATFRAAGKRDVSLYVLNLATGRASRAVRRNAIATRTGSKRDPLIGVAASGAVPDDNDPPLLRLRKRPSTDSNLLRGRALRLSVSYSEACTIRGELLLGKRIVGRTRRAVLGEPGQITLRLKLSKRGRALVRANRGRKLRVRLNGTDLAGNRTRRK